MAAVKPPPVLAFSVGPVQLRAIIPAEAQNRMSGLPARTGFGEAAQTEADIQWLEQLCQSRTRTAHR
ncbi:MAG TPA: hypothetical protein VK575_03345, partial [Gemmatimonadaceae bacterium]|nr:hypothetical protein [Gemmatimonadaceae bacterium]